MVQFKTRLHILPLRVYVSNPFRNSRTIANNTVAHNLRDSIGIDYHGNRIAEISDWEIYISNCGYGTATTRTRINSILADNHVPFRLSQKNRKQILSLRIPVYNDDYSIRNYKWTVVDPDFHTGDFKMDSGLWIYNKR